MDRPSVLRAAAALAAIGAAFVTAAMAADPADDGTRPAYTADGSLQAPKGYRTWVFLSSGLDMSYLEKSGMAGMSMFDNIFVGSAAYAGFLKTGVWPDKTQLVMEVRKGQHTGSINKHGRFQVGEPIGLEVHVKDQARFKGGWAFFAFDGSGTGKLLPQTAACYSCHAAHAAADTTFVQFYPTLLPVAEAKGTLSKAYLAERAAEPKSEPTPGVD
jgi:Cytochrome P460